MTLTNVRDALLTIGVPVFHFEATDAPNRYIVWAEDGSGRPVYANDVVSEQSVTGTIDYFTRTEYDGTITKIQSALDKSNISWRLNHIGYERDTGYIHYEWVFEAA